MAAENPVTIGAVFDGEQLAQSFREGTAQFNEELEHLKVELQQTSTTSQRAFRQISEEAKTMAASASTDFQRLSSATIANARAQAELRAAISLTRDKNLDAAATTQLLAGVQQKAAVAAEELKTAQQALRVEEEETSGITSELGGKVGELLGAYLSLEIVASRLEISSKFALDMRNLSASTGIAASELAGLHDVVDEMGIEFESVSVGLSKMAKSQRDAVNGGKAQIAAFRDMGISISELKTLTPEELFFRLAEGFEKSGSSAQKNAAAIAIFGRGGRELIPVFQVGADRLREWVKEAGAASGVTQENIDASQRWHSMMEQLSVAVRNAALENLPAFGEALGYVLHALDALLVPLKSTIYVIDAGFLSIVEEATGLGNVFKDLASGQFAKAASDAKDATDRIKSYWHTAATDLKNTWSGQGIFGKIADEAKNTKIPAIPKQTDEDLPGAGDKGKDTRLQEWQKELQQKRDAEDGFHQLGKTEEAEFWEAKLQLAQGNADLYGEVYHQMREAQRAAMQTSLRDEIDDVQQRVAATKSGSVERVAILSEEVAHLKAIGADQTPEYKRLQSELTAAVREEAAERARAEEEANRKAHEAFKQRMDSEIQATQEHGNRVLDEQLHNDDRRLAAHRISMGTWASDERSAIESWYDEQKTMLDRWLAATAVAFGKQSKEYADLMRKLQEIDDKRKADLEKVNDQEAKAWQQTVTKMGNTWFSGLNSWMQAQRSFAAAMGQSWNSILMSEIQAIEQGVLRALAADLRKLSSHAATNQAKLANDAATNAQGESMGLIAALKSVARAAGKAGAHAFSSVYEAVPFPFNVVLAPAAAAAAFAGTLAFGGSMNSASNGMVSAEEQMAFIHKNEMVLPAPLSLGFQKLLAGGGAATPAAAAASGHTFNFHIHGGSADPNEIADRVMDRVKRHTRTGGVIR